MKSRGRVGMPYNSGQLPAASVGSSLWKWYLQMYWQEMDHVHDIFETASMGYSVA